MFVKELKVSRVISSVLLFWNRIIEQMSNWVNQRQRFFWVILFLSSNQVESFFDVRTATVKVTETKNLAVNYSDMRENIPWVTRRLLTITLHTIKMEAKPVVYDYDILESVSQNAWTMVVG